MNIIFKKSIRNLLACCFQESFPFLRWHVLIPLLASCAFATAWLMWRFNTLGTDSVLYGLPLPFSKGPLSLFVPYIGDYPGYSSVWGHHWPGAMWLRGLLYSVIPFQRLADLSLLVAIQYTSGVAIGMLVWRYCRSKLATAVATGVVCMDRGCLSTIVDHRFESLAIFSVVILYLSMCFTAVGSASRRWWLAGSAAALMAAWSHPFSMLLGAIVIFLAFLDWLIFRKRPFTSVLTPAAFYCVGILAAVGYYLAVPEARELFLRNVSLQSSFSSGDRLIFFSYLQRSSMAAVIIWGAGLSASLWLPLARHENHGPFQRFCTWSLPVMIWSVPALYFLTSSANIVYMSFGVPFACAGFAIAASIGLLKKSVTARCASSIFLMIPLLTLSAYHSFRWLRFFQCDRPDFPSELRSWYEQIPSGHRVYFPPVLWDAARTVPGHDCRLWTLSVAAPRDIRLAYEQYSFRDAKAGDFLVIDRISFAHRDEWGVLPTYEIHPPDPGLWQHVSDYKRQFAGLGGSFGYDLGLYCYKGGQWDPSQSPRKLEGR